MIVRSGAEWTNTHTGSKRVLDLTLDREDGIENVGQEKWEAMSFTQKTKALRKISDVFIVVSMVSEGALSQEYADKRIKAIKES